MILKSIVLSSIVFLSFFFFDVLACKGEELSATEQEQRLDANYNSILDTNLTEVCTTYDDKTLSCLTTKPKIEYLYISDSLIVDDLYEDVSARTFNSRKLVIDNKATYQVYTGQPFIKVGEFWYQTETEFVDPEIFDQVTANKLSFLQTLFRNNPFGFYSVNAQVDPIYSTSEDGILVPQPSTTWTTVRDGTIVSDYSKISAEDCFRATKYGNNYYYIKRAYFPFLTSGVEGEIENVSFNFFSSNISSLTAKTIYLVEWSPDTPPNLTTTNGADVDNLGNASISSIMYDVTPETLHTMDFNATSTSLINQEGYSFFGLRIDEDFTGVAPGVAETDGSCLHFSEQTGTTYDPYLEITLAEEPPAQGTSTPYASNCTPDIMNDLGVINACSYTSSTTGVTYTNYHVPFILWLVIFIPIAIFLPRLITELVILFRGYD